MVKITKRVVDAAEVREGPRYLGRRIAWLRTPRLYFGQAELRRPVPSEVPRVATQLGFTGSGRLRPRAKRRKSNSVGSLPEDGFGRRPRGDRRGAPLGCLGAAPGLSMQHQATQMSSLRSASRLGRPAATPSRVTSIVGRRQTEND
jgi:hypothetical protein